MPDGPEILLCRPRLQHPDTTAQGTLLYQARNFLISSQRFRGAAATSGEEAEKEKIVASLANQRSQVT